MLLLGLDLGTTGCKSNLFNMDGAIVSESYIEYPLINTLEGYIEQDANIWWILIKKVIHETITKASVNAKDIKALGISTQGISFVPVDIEGNTLYNAISWLDTRSIEETEFIRTTFGDSWIYNKTGKRISAAYTITKMMWLRKNLPDIYDKSYKLLMPLDYLMFKFTGKAVTDHSIASGTMAYDIHKKNWDTEILAACDIDIEKLPEIKNSGYKAGFIKPEIALETGLSCETEIILGAQDQKCAALGAGIDKGICTVSLGTATAITSLFDAPVLDKHMRIPCFTLDESHWGN